MKDEVIMLGPVVWEFLPSGYMSHVKNRIDVKEKHRKKKLKNG